MQDASLSALPYVAGRPTLPAWPVVITRRVAACEKEATRPPTIVRGAFATRERCTMRARQASARTNDGAVSSLLANYSVGVKSQTLPRTQNFPRLTAPPRLATLASRHPRLVAPSPHGTRRSTTEPSFLSAFPTPSSPRHPRLTTPSPYGALSSHDLASRQILVHTYAKVSE